MAGMTRWVEGALLCFLLALLICRDSAVHAKKKGSDAIKKCETCRDLVKKFTEGMDRTDRYNFAGGDVDWEEKKLGSYATSETRFIEITEHLCGTNHECNAMFEKHEENLEEWWKGHQETDPDLVQWLCIDKMLVCCLDNRYGPDCEECLGGLERPCRDNGKCSGGGTRGGTGKCKCNGGYKGWNCEICKNGFYEVSKNETHTECKVCHDSCSSTCTGEGPKGCKKCKSGYIQDPEEGCKDVDECLTYPCSEKEFCENTQGSHKCTECHSSCNKCVAGGNTGCVQCKNGYSLEDGACTDINECEQENICSESMTCTNLPGSHYCDCEEGFTKMGEECIDKDLLQDLQSGKMTLPDPELGIKDNQEIQEDNSNIDQAAESQLQDDTNTNTNTAEHTKDPHEDDATVKGSFQSHNQDEQYEKAATTNVDDTIVDDGHKIDPNSAAENLDNQNDGSRMEL